MLCLHRGLFVCLFVCIQPVVMDFGEERQSLQIITLDVCASSSFAGVSSSVSSRGFFYESPNYQSCKCCFSISSPHQGEATVIQNSYFQNTFDLTPGRKKLTTFAVVKFLMLSTVKAVFLSKKIHGQEVANTPHPQSGGSALCSVFGRSSVGTGCLTPFKDHLNLSKLSHPKNQMTLFMKGLLSFLGFLFYPPKLLFSRTLSIPTFFPNVKEASLLQQLCLL